MEFFVDGSYTHSPTLNTEQNVICFADYDEIDSALSVLGIDATEKPWLEKGNATRFEARTGYDFFAIHIPDENILDGCPQITVFFTPRRLLVAHMNSGDVNALKAALQNGLLKSPTPEAAVYYLFSRLLVGEEGTMEKIETRLLELEDMVMTDIPDDFTEQIIDIRKEILVLKRYYEALYNLLQDIEENQNGFLTKHQLQLLRLHTNRADRLCFALQNLRDYTTQVREAYQSQLDIGLNKTMQLFTVITAIFLPLTLLVGWYGMNLQMPEFGSPIMYPVLIVASITIVAGLLIFFRRRKWF